MSTDDKTETSHPIENPIADLLALAIETMTPEECLRAAFDMSQETCKYWYNLARERADERNALRTELAQLKRELNRLTNLYNDRPYL